MRVLLLRFVITLSAIGALAGCQVLGPQSINTGRASYNDAIQETTKTQSLGNIVRVYWREPPLFMDVTEVAATAQIQASIQASGSVAAVSPAATSTRTRGNQATLQYQESPLVRYVPVIGSALTAQVATPISVDSISFLSDSNWSLSAMLSFAVNYITPAYTDLYPALNAILQLDDYGVLSIAQAKSSLTAAAPGSPNANAPLNDSLVLHVQPRHPAPIKGKTEAEVKADSLRLWLRLLRIYAGTQPQTGDNADRNLGVAMIDRMANDLQERRKSSAGLSEYVDQEFAKVRMWIELRVAQLPPAIPKDAIPPKDPKDQTPIVSKIGCVPGDIPSSDQQNPATLPIACSYLGPLMRTRSALGILKSATEGPNPWIAFVTPKRYAEITKDAWNNPEAERTFYALTLTREEEDAVRKKLAANPKSEDDEIKLEVNKRIKEEGPKDTETLLTYDINTDVRDYKATKLERRLAHSRRFLLIVEDDSVPGNAYVSYRHQGKFYYIAGNDEVSQRNFMLLSQFTVMQATPSPSALTPTISVGGK